MCSHYEAPETQRLIDGFGVAPEGQFKMDLWPCYEGPFIRLRDTESPDEEGPEFEALVGQFGLLPFWAKRGARRIRKKSYANSSSVPATPDCSLLTGQSVSRVKR